MNALKQHSKHFVKYLLSHFRAFMFHRKLVTGKYDGKLIIMMYHRVLPKTDPRLQNEEPGMYVTPETFDMHLRELNKISTLIHIEDWLDLADKNKLEKKLYCAITFDDGWADNYEFAFPILQKYKAPACIFLATDYIGSNTTFWPERLAALLNNYAHHKAALDAFFNELKTSIQTERLQLKDRDYVAELINTAKQLNDAQIKSALDEIEQNAAAKQEQGSSKDTDKHVVSDKKPDMLSWEQVKILSNEGVAIGGHTRSHLRLNNKATIEQVEYEVKGCHTDIKEKLGISPSLFCYPNGDTSNDAVTSVKNKFSAAVTTNKGINIANKDRFRLKRIGVHEDVSQTNILAKAVLYNSDM